MKKRISLTLILVIGIAGYFYFGGIKTTKQESIDFQTKNYAVARAPLNQLEEGDEKENPIERLEWEIAQLVDPSTGKIPDGIMEREITYAKQSLNRVAPEPYDPFNLPSAVAGTSAAAPFRNVGPFNIGGKTRAVGIDIDDEDIILAGGTASGVWKTTDQGGTWTRTTGLQQQPSLTTIVQDRRAGETDTWYYGSGENRGNSASDAGAFYFGNGIYKSTDNGDSWILIEATAVPGTSGTDVITERGDFSLIEQLAIDYSNASGTEIYAAGGSQIMRSEDGFETFNIVLGSTNTGGANMCDVAITSAGRVFATIATSSSNGSNAENGVFMSDDGITWTELDLAGLDNSYSRMEISINPSNEDQVYFLTNDQLISYNASTDTSTNLTASIDVSSDSGEGYNSQGGYDVEVKFHPGDDALVFVAGTNILRSTSRFGTAGSTKQIGGYRADGGNSNSFPQYPNHHPDIHELVFFDSDPNIMLSGTDGGVHVTRDNSLIGSSTSSTSVVWESLNNGYLTTQFHHANIHNYSFGDAQVMGGMQDNGTWASFNGEDAGDWVEISGGDGTYTAITYNALYSSSQRGNMNRFEAQGLDYNFAGNITPGPNATFSFVNAFNFNTVHQDQIFVAGRGRIFVTNDVRTNPSGNEWIELVGPASMTNRTVSALTSSTDPESVLYIGTTSGRLFKITDTRDLSASTEILTLDRGNMPNGNISAIAVDPNDADRVLVSFSNYNIVSIWLTVDGGETWSSISGNLEENANGSGGGPSIRGVEMMPDGNGGNYYFAATSVGLFMTQELNGDDTNWEQQGADVLGNIVIQNVRVRAIDGTVMAGTHASGVYLGSYDVSINANINYSINAGDTEYLLRANPSAITPSPLTYQWIKDGQNIDGETGETLTVTDGGSYLVRLGMSGEEATGLSNTVEVNLDGTPPDVSTITRLNPTDQATDLTTVQFQVTFSETVLNVSVEDFETAGAASGVIGTVTESIVGTVFDVTINNIGGSGELNLEIAASNDITDEVGNAFSGTVLAEENYMITDNTAPTAAILRGTPSTELTDQNEVTFIVTFTEGVDNVDITDFALATGSPTATLGTVTETTAGIYEVIVTDILADGTLGLDFLGGQDIADKAGNAFDGTVTTDLTYIIENVITSIDAPLARSTQRIIADANPSNGIFNLAFPPAFIGNFDMQVVDSQGQRVSLRAIRGYNTGDQVELDLTKSPNGVYILSATNGQSRASIRLLKGKGSR